MPRVPDLSCRNGTIRRSFKPLDIGIVLANMLLTPCGIDPGCSRRMRGETAMIKKLASFTKGSMRRIKTKTGGIKVVHVKAHSNRINRKPKRK